MSATYVSQGDRIDYTPTAAVTAGDVIVFSSRFVGIATEDIAANALGSLAVKGVFDITAGPGFTLAVGAHVYYDELLGKATTVSGGNVYLGLAVKAKTAAQEVARVRLAQSEIGATGTDTSTGTTTATSGT